MIAAVSFNPVLERVLTVHKFRVGDKNYCDTVSEVPSGFGITAARVINKLGEKVEVCSLLGQTSGELIRKKLLKERIPCHYFEIKEASRFVATVFDEFERQSTMVAIDPSPQVTLEEMAGFQQVLNQCVVKSDLILIGGSLPKGLPDDTYMRLVKKFKAVGKKVILDTSGQGLNLSPAGSPFMLKMNLTEARACSGQKLENQNEIRAFGSSLHSRGVDIVAITLGKAGAIAVCSRGTVVAVPPRIEAVNGYGSGDAFVAGFAVGLVRGKPIDECIWLATSCGVANALTLLPGQVHTRTIKKLYPRIEVRWLESALTT
ncbi:MAG: hexose kinase [Chloroflexi bacterium]|nr:hexose kinase [Chloroflexota bacterium]